MPRMDDNPTHVEGFVGFSFSEDGTYLHHTITDWKDSIRNKKFGYKIRVRIPQEVLDAARELQPLPDEDVSITAKFTLEMIEHEEPFEEETATTEESDS